MRSIHAPSRSRTYNLQIKSLLLCQLSYGCLSSSPTLHQTSTNPPPTPHQPSTNPSPTPPALLQPSPSPGAPGGNRTPDPQLRRLLLYPPELLALLQEVHSATPRCITPRRSSQSGRPDSNRRPPAPKAGAIPGYATPREESKNIQRAPQNQLPRRIFFNKAATARPRWLTRPFSAVLTSPNDADKSSLKNNGS